MNVCLQVFLLAAIFYTCSTALKCKQCKGNTANEMCKKYEEKECSPGNSDYCYDLFYNGPGARGYYLERGCSSEANLKQKCMKSSKDAICVTCKSDLCNGLSKSDIIQKSFS